MDADQLVEIYIKIRDKRSQLKKEFDNADGRLEKQLELVGDSLLELCKETNAEGLRTNAGSVFKTIKTRYWTSDWGSMKDFIKENDAFELMEQRVHQTNMKNYLVENPDKMPPGMNIDSRYGITVRRNNK
jgi:hypothetical protein